jgi:tetratricopeptide (TPR) repeat protein
VGDYDNAVQSFQYAVAAKNNLANAHYNLAVAYSQNNKLDDAITEMTTVLSLITDKNSQDYQVARKALQDLQDKKQTAAQAGKELNPPQEGEQVLEPPVELPEGSEPPEAPLTPTPTPSPSALTPSPTGVTGTPGATGTISPSPTVQP